MKVRVKFPAAKLYKACSCRSVRFDLSADLLLQLQIILGLTAEPAAAGSSDRPHIGHSHAVKTRLEINMFGVCPKKEDKEQLHSLSGWIIWLRAII